MKTTFFLYLSIHLLSGYFYQMPCEVDIPTSSDWSGKTINGSLNTYGQNPSITIEALVDDRIQVSDFSCGFLDAFGFGFDHPLELEIDCATNTVKPKSFISDFGECLVTEGYWNSAQKKLTIHWKIDFNSIDEISEFTFN